MGGASNCQCQGSVGPVFAGCGSVRVSYWTMPCKMPRSKQIRWIRSVMAMLPAASSTLKRYRTSMPAPSPGLALFCSETQKRYYVQLYNDSIPATGSHNSQPDPGEASLTRRNPRQNASARKMPLYRLASLVTRRQLGNNPVVAWVPLAEVGCTTRLACGVRTWGLCEKLPTRASFSGNK